MRLKILVADDSRVNLKIASTLLQDLGHEVVTAKNGLEAVEATQQTFFDVILMDVEMPEMDGLEATGRIRMQERKYGRHTPVIAMTAHTAHDELERFTAAGMDHYLAKPVEAPRLVESLQLAMSAKLKAPATPPVARWALDRQQFLSRIGYDKELLNEVVTLFGQDALPS
jgi:two-component system sensor histidine kinase/response regulator